MWLFGATKEMWIAINANLDTALSPAPVTVTPVL